MTRRQAEGDAVVMAAACNGRNVCVSSPVGILLELLAGIFVVLGFETVTQGPSPDRVLKLEDAVRWSCGLGFDGSMIDEGRA